MQVVGEFLTPYSVNRNIFNNRKRCRIGRDTEKDKIQKDLYLSVE